MTISIQFLVNENITITTMVIQGFLNPKHLVTTLCKVVSGNKSRGTQHDHLINDWYKQEYFHVKFLLYIVSSTYTHTIGLSTLSLVSQSLEWSSRDQWQVSSGQPSICHWEA